MKDNTQAARPKLKSLADPTVRRVYWLNSMERELEDGTRVTLRPAPEVLAVAIAKCSRSDTPFDQNVYEATEESAAAFHEKWVVGFGHSSVAEHAVASVALENVSQVVIKIIEDARLASFTEKSSRYQVFSAQRYVIPPRVAHSAQAQSYRDYMSALYRLYQETINRLDPYMREKFPNETGMKEGVYTSVIKARSCDVARYLLPAAAMTSFGVTANARNWAAIITKLLSSPHPEAQEIGRELIEVLHGGPDMDDEKAIKRKPFRTLLKYTDFNPYQASLHDDLGKLAKEISCNATGWSTFRATSERPVVLLDDDAEAEHRIAAALLTRHSNLPIGHYLHYLRKIAPANTSLRVIEQALAKRGPHDAPPREFEHATFSHEILLDFGAWRDIQRHRICSPLNQTLGVHEGYEFPPELADIGLEDDFRKTMQRAADFHARLVQNGLAAEAEYVVPMAYRRRMFVTWNLRELFHFIELRSGPKGHQSYRRIAQETWRTLDAAHPDLAKHIRVDLSGTTLSTLGAKPKGI
jgi:thymidylate synthase ThyX